MEVFWLFPILSIMSTIFTKIIQWTIPSYKIYEDEQCFAFLTIEPHNLWHTLIVPREEVGNFLDVPDELLSHIMSVGKNLLWPAIQRATQCARIGVVVEWFGVPDHFHLHLMPLFKSWDLDSTHAHKESEESLTSIQQAILREMG